jgi:hypothetical protein
MDDFRGVEMGGFGWLDNKPASPRSQSKHPQKLGHHTSASSFNAAAVHLLYPISLSRFPFLSSPVQSKSARLVAGL